MGFTIFCGLLGVCKFYTTFAALSIRKGEMPEWSIGAVSKTVVPFWNPGFESLSLRCFLKNC